MSKGKVWCLFEQSGTFKNVIKSYGYEAVDVDICNHYGETDIICNLFTDIWLASGQTYEENIFDEISKDDIVLAFFPCIKFTEKIFPNSRCQSSQFKAYSTQKKIEFSRKYMSTICKYYTVFCQLYEVALKLGLRMVIENPYPNLHFLNMFFPVDSTVKDYNRAEHGDWYKKPTQYWFINIDIPDELREVRGTAKPLATVKNGNTDVIKGRNYRERRRMISPKYADWFFRTYILENLSQTKENKNV